MNVCDVDYDVCPYDKSHMILKSRMLVHLSKCSKNFPDCEKKTCVYNIKHVVPEPEMEYHLATCPDRIRGDMFKNKVGDIECPVKNEAPVSLNMPASEENWDDESSAVTSVLNVIQSEISNKDIFRTNAVIGKSKAKRKAIRKEEIMRHTIIKENEISNGPLSTVSPLCKIVSHHNEPTEEAIRTPVSIVNQSNKIQSQLSRDNHPLRPPSVLSDCGSSKSNKFANVDKRSNKGGSNSRLHDLDIVKLSDELNKDLKIKSNESSKSDISVNSKCSNKEKIPSGCSSYASLLANQNKSTRMRVLSPTNSSKSENNMEVLTSSIFEKGPRGRGRSINSSPAPSSSSSLSMLNEFSTDENGFLLMPVPGKGRGKRLPQY